MVHEVFISYAKEDRKIADRVCAELEGNGIACWIAPRDIPPAEKWTPALLRAIDTCHLFLLIFSSSSNSSPYVMNEVETAFNKGKVILPFRVEDLEPNEELAFMIGGRQWLNAFSSPHEQYLPLLVKTVRANSHGTHLPTPGEKQPVTTNYTAVPGQVQEKKLPIDIAYRSPRLLLRRFFAYFVDLVLGLLLGFFIIGIALAIDKTQLFRTGSGVNTPLGDFMVGMSLLIGMIGYFIVFDVLKTPSPGKKFSHLRIMDMSHGMTRGKSVMRVLVKTAPFSVWVITITLLENNVQPQLYLSLAVFFVFQLLESGLIFYTPRAQSLHDLFAETTVVDQ